MKTTSWVLLSLVGFLIVLAGVGSSFVAYRTAADQQHIGSVTLQQLTAGHSDAETVMRAQRGTAAAYAAGYGTLGPYRRREVWCWWAILVATLALFCISVARVPVLGTWRGANAAAIEAGIVVLALLLDVGRLKAK